MSLTGNAVRAILGESPHEKRSVRLPPGIELQRLQSDRWLLIRTAETSGQPVSTTVLRSLEVVPALQAITSGVTITAEHVTVL